MTRDVISEHVTLDRLNELFAYDPDYFKAGYYHEVHKMNVPDMHGALRRKVARGSRSAATIAGAIGCEPRWQGSYWCVKIDDKSYKLHRLVWFMAYGEWPNQIDHINHNGLDNRLENLRPVTNKENQENRQGPRRDAASGIRGVSWYPPASKWRARIKHNGKEIWLGYFETKDEAEQAAGNARVRFFTHSQD